MHFLTIYAIFCNTYIANEGNKQEMADPGDIVVALIDRNETTLKRFYPQPETGEIWLHPENPAEPEQYYAAKRVSIQGVAVKVIKNL